MELLIRRTPKPFFELLNRFWTLRPIFRTLNIINDDIRVTLYLQSINVTIEKVVDSKHTLLFHLTWWWATIFKIKLHSRFLLALVYIKQTNQILFFLKKKKQSQKKT